MTALWLNPQRVTAIWTGDRFKFTALGPLVPGPQPHYKTFRVHPPHPVFPSLLGLGPPDKKVLFASFLYSAWPVFRPFISLYRPDSLSYADLQGRHHYNWWEASLPSYCSPPLSHYHQSRHGYHGRTVLQACGLWLFMVPWIIWTSGGKQTFVAWVLGIYSSNPASSRKTGIAFSSSLQHCLIWTLLVAQAVVSVLKTTFVCFLSG